MIEDYASALCLQVVHQREGNWLLGEGRSNYYKCTILCNITYISNSMMKRIAIPGILPI